MKRNGTKAGATRKEALHRAVTGTVITNYPAIYAGFMEKGISDADILPRENVFTYNAWKALGRFVRKGEHGVRVVTVQGYDKVDDETGIKIHHSYPTTTVVFHVSQTEPMKGQKR